MHTLVIFQAMYCICFLLLVSKDFCCPRCKYSMGLELAWNFSLFCSFSKKGPPVRRYLTALHKASGFSVVLGYFIWRGGRETNLSEVKENRWLCTVLCSECCLSLHLFPYPPVCCVRDWVRLSLSSVIGITLCFVYFLFFFFFLIFFSCWRHRTLWC